MHIFMHSPFRETGKGFFMAFPRKEAQNPFFRALLLNLIVFLNK